MSRIAVPAALALGPQDLGQALDHGRLQPLGDLVDQHEPRRDMSARATSSIFCSPPDSVPARCCQTLGDEREDLADAREPASNSPVVAEAEPADCPPP